MTESEVTIIIAKLNTLETALVGIEGTDNRGMCGELKEIKQAVRDSTEQAHNLDIRLTKLEERHRNLPGSCPAPAQPSLAKKAGLLGSIGLFFGGVLYGLGCKLGWW